MKSALHPLRRHLDSSALLDRGGRPTLRELLGGLDFDAATGALRLNGTRVTLNLIEADRILRRELVQMLGEDEARIVLLRRGFRMGLNDAAFIARSWPALDRGDAFTAGTRLHQFSGVVRVETLHNDFDFARGRFSAEFLWHNSAEAEDGGDPLRLTARPVCWQQLGYASGYATHFFGAPVIYKETACAAMGHRACKVVGRLASGWGEDDPDVRLFRSRILPPAPVERRVVPALSAPPERAEAALLAPILPALERAARLPLPCLIAGPGRCGQDAAAAHLLRLTGRAEGTVRLYGPATGAEALRAALAQFRKPRRRDLPPILLIEGIEGLAPEAQTELAHDLAEADPHLRPGLIATAALPPERLAAMLEPALWSRLAPLVMALPALAARTEELPALALLRLEVLAARLGLPLPAAEPDALAALPPPHVGLDGLDALLTALLIATMDGATLTAQLVTTESARLTLPDRPDQGDGIDGWIADQLAGGGFSLDRHEARIRAAALAQAGGNLSAAARLLGISRAQLAYRQRSENG